ncbi:hypothetical protein QYM36_017412 [Artemia franciscana]|uniref:Uncharacterized protein n=1 Tax=Artemia franciscana TaxID=6661 RepID=A0AA88HHN5_ARTSF|nr:hypothetical protein QYM36_017412 [Artemia franciscana]
MKGMKASKTLNPDGIPSFILKELRDELCEPLAILFRIPIEQCKFPTSWKLSHVTPIFKGKGKQSPGELSPDQPYITIPKNHGKGHSGKVKLAPRIEQPHLRSSAWLPIKSFYCFPTSIDTRIHPVCPGLWDSNRYYPNRPT